MPCAIFILFHKITNAFLSVYASSKQYGPLHGSKTNRKLRKPQEAYVCAGRRKHVQYFFDTTDFSGENAYFSISGKRAITEFYLYVKKSHNLFWNDIFENNVRTCQDKK